MHHHAVADADTAWEASLQKPGFLLYRLAAAVQFLTGALEGASPARLEIHCGGIPDRIPPQRFVGIRPASPDGLHNLLCTSVGRI